MLMMFATSCTPVHAQSVKQYNCTDVPEVAAAIKCFAVSAVGMRHILRSQLLMCYELTPENLNKVAVCLK
jgi:hypothetical protein